jgi:4-carboxymuconolactone decarboxylase
MEAILLSTVYAGFPASLNGTFAAKEVFERRGVLPDHRSMIAHDERHERGLRALKEVSGGSGPKSYRALNRSLRTWAGSLLTFRTGTRSPDWALITVPKSWPPLRC